MKLDTATPPQLAAALRSGLARGLAGRRVLRTMAPELAYGRHYGPVPRDARRAAVLLLASRDTHGWAIPAILRPATMKAHAGQVSLPGGMIEPGETPVDTALREFMEELGVVPAGVQIVGHLSPAYVFISNFEVTPIVAVSPLPLLLRPNPDEVEEVVRLPINELVDPACRGCHLIRRHDLVFRAPHFAIAGRNVWGATSLILAEFAELIATTGPTAPEATALY
jgi:8-oxo-dGTP pyrophosphatase MutT (NUDIX family)